MLGVQGEGRRQGDGGEGLGGFGDEEKRHVLHVARDRSVRGRVRVGDDQRRKVWEVGVSSNVYVKNVRTVRERELAAALVHAIELIEEICPGQGDLRRYRNVLADDFTLGEKSIMEESPEIIDVEGVLVEEN